MEKYGYLKQYIIPRWTSKPGNTFYLITENEINDAEGKLKFRFPQGLKTFWLTVGAGFFESTAPEVGITDNNYSNRLLHPQDIVSILTEGIESGIITEQGLELLNDGDIPFFEIADSTSYLVMKPGSDNPNAVYRTSGRMIEDSLEKFIWKLYHVSPTYYL